VNLLSTMDALLRDPETVYQRAAEGRDLGKLCGQLLAIFVLTAALYGAAMGAFRWVHLEYFFSNFELKAPDGRLFEGSVAGMNVATNTVYTPQTDLPRLGSAQIRFNASRPSDPYHVQSIGEEGGYGAIMLARGPALREAAAWRIPPLVALKVPVLFVLTLAICAMAFYVLNLALGIRLHLMPVMTTMAFGLAATGVMLGVLAPITALFSIVTENYHFMKVLHLLVFALSGLFGVKVLYRGLIALAPNGSRGVAALVLACLLLYCVVGGQVAWTLKPFLGTPYLPATPPFRAESGNIYVSFFQSLSHVASPRQCDPWSRTSPGRDGDLRGSAPDE
jgi:hypothetical protein